MMPVTVVRRICFGATSENTPFPRTPVNKGKKKRKGRTESSSRALQDAG
jgi:hypothetical protein